MKRNCCYFTCGLTDFNLFLADKMYRIGKLCLRSGTDQGKLTVSMSSCRLFSTSTSCQKRRKDEKSQPVKSTPGLRSNVKSIIGGSTSAKDPMSVFKPILVKPNPDDLNFGEEIAGKINKQALLKELLHCHGNYLYHRYSFHHRLLHQHQIRYQEYPHSYFHSFLYPMSLPLLLLPIVCC